MKKCAKMIAAFLAAMLLMLLGMRLFGIITIRNSASDLENFTRILHSPDQHLTDLTDVYKYEHKVFNLIALLFTLFLILLLCAGKRNGFTGNMIRRLRKRVRGKRLPNISAVAVRIASFLKGLQYGQISDVKRRYRLIMIVSGRQQEYLFAADKSDKPPVMDLSCFDAVETAGEGVVRISVPRTVLLWNRRGVSLITKGEPFRVVGEDRTANRVHLSSGEQISVRVGETTISFGVS